MLESAIARPRFMLSFSAEVPSLAQLATAYAFGIAKNHPFIDGNKRTAAVVLETFIELNGHRFMETDDVMYANFLKLAEGAIGESEFANWVDNGLQPK